MHIPDGWIDVPTSAGAAVLAVGATAVAARRAGTELRAKVTTLPAVVAAYVLVAQLLVFPVGFGTGAHLVGTGLATLLVGPAVAIVCVAVVVVVQALLLADGGVTALGLNLVNDGLVPALVAYVAYRAVSAVTRSVPLAAGVAGALSSLAAGLAAALEFAIGGTDVVSTTTVVTTIGGAHLLVAAAEGLITAAVVRAVLRLRPDFARMVRPARPTEPIARPSTSPA